MATLALTLVGAAIGSSFTGIALASGAIISGLAIGAMIGGLVGTAIDTFFLFDQGSMSVPAQQIDGQRLNDVMMMTASEGTPMFECHGIYNKIPGQVLYVSNIRETSVTTIVSCFVAGSKINMADGTFRPIESIKVGDKVKSCKLPKYFKKWRRPQIVEGVVTEVNNTEKIVRLIQITDSRTQTYRLTAGHPVFADGEWRYACNVKAGMKLLSVFGDHVPIEVASVETIDTSYANGRVYNLEVEGEHNYFVDNVLFHNGGKGGSGSGGGQPQIEQTRYYYDVDLVIGVADATNGKQINSAYNGYAENSPGSFDRGRGEGIRKIWFNDKQAWDSYIYRGNVTNPGYVTLTGGLNVKWTGNMGTVYVDEVIGDNIVQPAYSYQYVQSFDITYTLTDATNDQTAVAFGESVAGNDPWFIQFLTSGYTDFIGSANGNNIGNNSGYGVCLSRSVNHVTMRYTPTVTIIPPQNTHPQGIYAQGVNWNYRPFAATGGTDNFYYGNQVVGSPSSVTINNAQFRWSSTVTPWKPGTFGTGGAATFYDGTQSNPDSTVLTGAYSAGDVPCFKGTSYISMRGIQLEDFGNTIPQTVIQVQAVAETGTDYLQANADDAISRILTDAGWTTDGANGTPAYDVSGIADNAKNTLWGYATSGVSTLESRLKPLMLYYDLRARQESDGKLHFYEASATGTAYEATASSTELACKEPGEPPQQPLEVSDTVNWRLPSQINATYYDINKQLQRGSAVATKIDFGTDLPNVKNLHFPVASTAGRAKQRVSQILWEAEQFRQTASLRLPPNRIDVLTGDLLTVTNSAGESFAVRVNEINRGDNYLHEITGVLEDARFTDFDEDADDNQGTQPETGGTIPELLVSQYQEAALLEGDVSTPTFYFGGCASQLAQDDFSGAIAAISFDGTNWSFASSYPGNGQASAGQLIYHTGTSVLGEWANPETIDTVNTARIRLTDGATLTNATELEMLDGKNRILIGREYIGFMTASLISTDSTDGSKIYDLTGLLRNIRGNVGDLENRMVHLLFDPVLVVANGNTVNSFAKHSGTMDQVGQTIYFKLIPDGAEQAEVDNGGSTVFSGGSVKNLSPCNISVHRFSAGFDNTDATDASFDPNLPPLAFQANDIIVRFNRRGRTLKKIFSTTGMPQIPNDTIFDMEVMATNADNALVKRTISHDDEGNDGTSYPLYDGQYQVVYTAAQQTADFGSVRSAGNLHIRLNQKGDLIAKGYEAKVTG